MKRYGDHLTETRYPWASLAEAMGLSESAACQVLGVTGKTEQDYRRRGVTELVAERLAIKAGLHPFVVWPALTADRVDEVEAERRAKATARNTRYRERHPDVREKLRDEARRYYAETRDYALAERHRRYWADPEAARAKRRASYAAVDRDERRRRAAARYQRERDARLAYKRAADDRRRAADT